MKKTLFGALLLSAVTLSAQAQISVGTKLLTGSIGYSQSKGEDNSAGSYSNSSERKDKAFYFNPSLGYFVADNLVLGVQGGMTLTDFNNQRFNGSVFNGQGLREKSEGSARTLSAGVFGRYYKFVGEKMALYGQLGGGYYNGYSSSQYMTYQFQTNHNNERRQGGYANLLPGIVFFPTDKLGLELTLRGIGYNRGTTKRTSKELVTGERSDSDTTDSGFDFGFGLNSLALGISLYLGRN